MSAQSLQFAERGCSTTSATFQKEEFSSFGAQWVVDAAVGPVFATYEGLQGPRVTLHFSNLTPTSDWSYTVTVGATVAQEEVQTNAVTIHLQDDSLGDQFDVDLYTDPVFGTPVFRGIAGQSRCPHEPGTVARESVEMTVNPPVGLIPPEQAAVFTVTLTNNVAPLRACVRVLTLHNHTTLRTQTRPLATFSTPTTPSMWAASR